MPPSNKSYTPPKGKPTAGRDEDAGTSRRIPPILEWILLGLVILAILAAAFIFARDSDGSPHNGAPADGGTAEIVATTTA